MKGENLQQLASHGFAVPAFRCFAAGSAVDLSFSAASHFAVRSDFAAEDGENLSFAGQFETRLNVPRAQVQVAAEEIARRARQQAVPYEKAHAVTPQDGGQIIVQEMVQADCAGVLFTANPQGILNEMVATIGAGLGDGVVEDRVPTVTYYYNRSAERYYAEAQVGAPTVEEHCLSALFAAGDEIEALFARPMDVEFAVQNGKVWFLQARPITTLPTGQSIVLDHSNIAESFPGLSQPATVALAERVYAAVFHSCVKQVAGAKTAQQLAPVLQQMVACANGRLYYRISNWYALLARLPFSRRLIAVWQEMLGVTERQLPPQNASKVRLWEKGKTAVSFVVQLCAAPRRMRQLQRFFADFLPQARQRLQQAADNKTLLALYEELIAVLGEKWGVTLLNDLYAFVFTALAKRHHASELQDMKTLASMEPVRALEELVRTARQNGMESEVYRVAQAEYIMQYGDRSMEELKLETHTLRTDPALLEQAVRCRLTQADGATCAVAAPRRDAWSVRRAKIGIMGRESARLNRSRCFGLAREIYRRLGQNLWKNGTLQQADDVFWLTPEEIAQGDALRQTVQARQAQYAAFATLPDCPRLVFADHIFDKAPQAVQIQNTVQSARQLRGVPCSGGRVRGRVLVVEQPSLTLDTDGRILVARTTDPGWVFLIERAAGVVAEQGSLLSHTAIVTRELHKPSVVAVPHAATLLRDGMEVELDGDAGTVTCIAQEERT